MKHGVSEFIDLKNRNEKETVAKFTEVQDECDSKSH